MPEYEKIKAELVAIAEILKNYPDELQPQVFKLLIEEYLGRVVNIDSGGMPELQGQALEAKQSGPKKRTPQKESYRIVSDLDLSGGPERQSFRKFVEEKNPGPGIEFNVVAVYYLERVLGINEITLEHIYTCYKDASRKPPMAFRQSLTDTASRTGHIDTKNMNSITLTIRGENFVEHDLPKKAGQEAQNPQV